MKKNVISIVIDSVSYNSVFTKNGIPTPMPFLKSLLSNSVWAEKMYSQGPYTDAAMKALYTGSNVLDDYGYFYRLNKAKNNHFSFFKNNGYETYGIFYPYYMNGEKILNDIDHVHYNSCFLFSSESGGVFEYFLSLLKNGKLTAKEEELGVTRLELMFKIWIKYYEDILSDNQKSILIKNQFNVNEVSKSLFLLNNEFELFKQDKSKYFRKFLLEKLDYFNQIDKVNVRGLIDSERINNVLFKDNKKFINYIDFKSFTNNVFRPDFGLKRFLKSVSLYLKSKDKYVFYYIKNYFECINCVKHFKKVFTDNHWQNMPSAKRQLDFAAEEINSRKEQNRPYYYSVHLLDPHEYISFFSYDINDNDVLRAEINDLFEYVKTIPNKFHGSLIYYLSLRYVDSCLKSFFEKIDLSNVTVLITADHGTSFSYDVLHGPKVNNFNEECYHVPCLIFNKHFNQKKIDSFCSSKSILPTLAKLSNLDYSTFKCKPFDETRDNFVLTEYNGPGCPDFISKEFWLSARDDNYIVGRKIKLSDSLEDAKIAEVYNLNDDKNGLFNVAKKIKYEKIEYLDKKIISRFLEIRRNIGQNG
ncbi:MAG: sulfatase-like hydrolase/transferase [Candidatus Izemoplasmatales bacterium]|nr:sulfatase-like hydrolase/transferase [Candidatus Izemoplasmatales bacterium]